MEKEIVIPIHTEILTGMKQHMLAHIWKTSRELPDRWRYVHSNII